MVDDDTIKLVEKWAEAEKKVIDNLSKKKNFSGECYCDNHPDTIQIIHNGDFDEIVTLCLECGGVKW